EGLAVPVGHRLKQRRQECMVLVDLLQLLRLSWLLRDRFTDQDGAELIQEADDRLRLRLLESTFPKQAHLLRGAADEQGGRVELKIKLDRSISDELACIRLPDESLLVRYRLVKPSEAF